MTAKNTEAKFALEFPQGRIVFMQPEHASSGNDIGGIYFQPKDSKDAFIVWGERKELFGKHAVTVAKNRDTGNAGYSVVYEFENNALVDARLVSPSETVRGALLDNAGLQALNAQLAAGDIKLYGNRDTELAKVFNVAAFADGRQLIQLMNKNELYLGTPGNFEKLDAKLFVQGGNSMYYKLATGESINLPYGYGGPNHEVPTFAGEPMKYLDVRAGEDPAKLGLNLKGGVTPLDPFSPQLKAPKP